MILDFYKMENGEMRMHYTEIKQTAERYQKIAKAHPNEFWAVYLFSAANMVAALCDQSEARYHKDRPMIDVDGEGDSAQLLKAHANGAQIPSNADELFGIADQARKDPLYTGTPRPHEFNDDFVPRRRKRREIVF